MPAWSAFRTWRVVAGGGFARIAKAHRNNRDLTRVVELHRCQTKPVAQPVAGWIVPRNAGSMDLRPGAWPTMHRRADIWTCKTGRRPHGKAWAQCVQARIFLSSC